MELLEKENLAQLIVQTIRNLQSEPGEWVNLADLGAPLGLAKISYKALGFSKLKPFLLEFDDVLEFTEQQIGDHPAIVYARPKENDMSLPDDGAAPNNTPIMEMHAEEAACTDPCTPEPEAAQPIEVTMHREGKFPPKDPWLFSWAAIHPGKIKDLSELALEEKWYYGEPQAQVQEELPILRNYLAYTFKRLCFEHKIMYEEDPDRHEEYAAFNTGLVDRKYEYIYALFKQNTRYPTPYWYLVDFVVAGEDAGKTLNKLFNPLPARADYFENKIENMLYDTSTGELSCDYTHILTERTYRLPLEFFEDNCPPDFTCIDGVNLEDVYFSTDDAARRAYFAQLGEKILHDNRIFKRLKNRLEDAVDLALKRVEWNYKTAIPMYYPTQNRGSLLLPLALVDEDRVDLALVVERHPSGSYQGQTVLPLNLAYANSRLVTRPDSDWLKTNIIANAGMDDTEDE